jgi:hypothetical protein
MISDASLAGVLRLLCPNAESSSINRAIEVLRTGGLQISRSEWPPVNREIQSFSDSSKHNASTSARVREAVARTAIDEIRRQMLSRSHIEVRRIDEMTDEEFERFCETEGD